MNPAGAYDAGTYYSVTVDDVEYKMALAEVVTKTEMVDGEEKTTRELKWDLTPLGILWDDCTYKAEFVVWPNQEAYDYVAGLNNGISSYTWNENTAEEHIDSNGDKYWSNGVDGIPSIVKYEDGTYAVLTNTHQETVYYVAKVEDGELVDKVGPKDKPLTTPNPMKLEATGSRLVKIWNVDRDPEELLRLLYEFGEDGNPLVVDGKPVPKPMYQLDENGDVVYVDGEPVKTSDGFFIEFTIKQDGNTYHTIRLGWVETVVDGQKVWKYEWYVPAGATESEIAELIKKKSYGNVDLEYGTKWAHDFSISTGMMLTLEQLQEDNLNPDDYASCEYKGVEYYFLEYGHDYTISEPNLGYDFDFEPPTYHPMLVDGVLKNVLYEKTVDGNGKVTVTSISSIENIEFDQESGESSLSFANTLRGYLHLKKVIVGQDSSTQVPDDKSDFAFTIELTNDSGPFTVAGDHIPWYGINGLFYHTEVDGSYQYYQAYANGEGSVILTDEAGNTYYATCTGTFAENYGPAAITYTDESGEKTITLFGNQMHGDEDTKLADGVYTKVSDTITINQDQTLTIANIPVGTSYKIVEGESDIYELVDITYENTKYKNKNNKTYTFEGEIIPDQDNNVTYKNKKVDGKVSLTKRVTFNNQTPTKESDYQYLNGTYRFLVFTDEACTSQYMVGDSQLEVSLTIYNAASNNVELQLPVGEYWLKEEAEGTGALPIENPIHVTVTASNATTPVEVEFVNNYNTDTDKDKIAIELEKKFVGLVNKNQIPAGFKVVLSYKVDGVERTYDLTNMDHSNYGTDGINVDWSESEDGLTWHWRITNIPYEAETFKVCENNYDTSEYYKWDGTTLNGSSVEDPSIPVEEVMLRPTISITNVTTDYQTTDSMKTFEVLDNQILFIRMTSQATVVVSQKVLSKATRDAIEKAILDNGGKIPNEDGDDHHANAQWVMTFIYYSHETHGNKFTYGNRDVFFEGNYVKIPHKSSSQEARFDISYVSESGSNSFVYVNEYKEKTISLEITKIDAATVGMGSDTVYLEGAEFTLTKMIPGAHISLDPTVRYEGTTDADGKLTFYNIKQGYYELKETVSPAGYNMLSGPIYIKYIEGTVRIIQKTTDDIEGTPKNESWVENWPEIGTIPDGNLGVYEFYPQGTQETTYMTIGNRAGAALPSTGGRGSLAFTVAGITLTVTASAILTTRKKKEND